MGLVADRGGEVDHRIDPAQGLALKVPVAEASEVAQGDLNVHAMPAQPAGIANEGTHVVPGFQQQR
jgi:hypothetical protein